MNSKILVKPIISIIINTMLIMYPDDWKFALLGLTRYIVQHNLKEQHKLYVTLLTHFETQLKQNSIKKVVSELLNYPLHSITNILIKMLNGELTYGNSTLYNTYNLQCSLQGVHDKQFEVIPILCAINYYLLHTDKVKKLTVEQQNKYNNLIKQIHYRCVNMILTSKFINFAKLEVRSRSLMQISCEL